ncbi:MAG: cobalamin biosynthesis protein CbiD [Euryarchaeota archaeon]|nr:cobalamin biosynthesis protein CbiD [Euryarchaeota archaeon]
MRYGYTTGACAAAAAKAACLALRGERPEEVRITLPAGKSVSMRVAELRVGRGRAKACVLKDAGDDPDITHGVAVCAEVRAAEGEEVVIRGGEGVGVVTKRGLGIPVGESAITEVPRRMIVQAVREVLQGGAEVVISIPGGEELASRTLNPKLGITGGLSVLGTTGIVVPWSESALLRSLEKQVDVALASGFKELVLAPGRLGERYAVSRGVPEDAVVQCGNYIGYMLERCARAGATAVLVCGHAGKLVKLASGIFCTHSRVADARAETLAAHAAWAGADATLLQELRRCTTVEEAVELLRRSREEVLYSVAEAAARRCTELAGIGVSVVMLNRKPEAVAWDSRAGEMKWGRCLL